ncbi:pilus assembly protein TadG-related protein [Segeticoccus rhizosphaerae]|uniref:pilus assembly protein TadG-related protein n=1 Tax=Segeticoccus rhizosphaerae TaxID=1104777 RepID=UPI0010C09F95|nr:pilus assembly protein TadG-related protein [Ornithinicoccus soli]
MPHGIRQDRERGSISITLALGSFVMIVLVGLAVDLGGRVHAQQQSRDVAAQAARAAGQEVLAGPAVRGSAITIDTHAAAQAAREYLSAAGVEGSVSVASGDQVVVSTTGSYPTTFLSIIGIGDLPVTGHATARLVGAENGSGR